MKTIELKLHCDLGPGDLLERSQEMAQALREKLKLEQRRAATMKDFRDQLDEINGRLASTAEAIREKAEFRLVKCVVKYHSPVHGTKRTVRLDTGEYVRDEPMTDSERQMNLLDPVQVEAYAPVWGEPSAEPAADPAEEAPAEPEPA